MATNISWAVMCKPPRAVELAIRADMRDRQAAPLYVVSASHWGNAPVSPDIRAHIGKHPELINATIRHWLDTRYLQTLTTFTDACKAGITSGGDYAYMAFWCKYGERASVAAGEITAVLLMHLPGVRIVVEHVHSLTCEAFPGSLRMSTRAGGTPASRRRALS